MVTRKGAVAVIPARWGSKRLPQKNILPLGGKPLIAWTIEAALESSCFEDVVVSSENSEILAIAERYGSLTHIRCEQLASDTSSTVDVILATLDWLEKLSKQYATCVLLQPTSPLRTAWDIQEAIKLYHSGVRETVISVHEIGIPSGWCGTVGPQGELIGFAALMNTTQNYQPVYRLNGAIYVFDCVRFRLEGRYQTERNRGYIMPIARGIDIDTHFDFFQCEQILAAREDE